MSIASLAGARIPHGGDPFFANVGYLLHFDNPAAPQVFPDVIGNTWYHVAVAGSDTAVSATNPKWGGGSLKMKTGDSVNDSAHLATSSLAHGSYSLGPGSKFTLEGWIYWSGNIDSRASYGEVLNNSSVVVCGIVFYTSGQIDFVTQLSGAPDHRYVSPPLSQWVHVALTYDGTTKRWFVNGALIGSAVLSAGLVQTIASYRIRGAPSGNPAAPIAYMDDLRFTYGVCRYTSAFTPPTKAFPDS